MNFVEFSIAVGALAAQMQSSPYYFRGPPVAYEANPYFIVRVARKRAGDTSCWRYFGRRVVKLTTELGARMTRADLATQSARPAQYSTIRSPPRADA